MKYLLRDAWRILLRRPSDRAAPRFALLKEKRADPLARWPLRQDFVLQTTNAEFPPTRVLCQVPERRWCRSRAGQWEGRTQAAIRERTLGTSPRWRLPAPA